MTKQQIEISDTVRVHDYDGRISDPVTVTELWGDAGQATVSTAVLALATGTFRRWKTSPPNHTL